MSFEVFQQVGASTKIYISIASSKTFGFPRTFLDKYGITTDHRVVLLYDAEAELVALHFTKEAVKYGMKVFIPNPQHGGSINARSFFDIKSIDAAKYAGRYEHFEELPLRSLGIPREGSAFVIKLRDKSSKIPAGEEGM